MAVRRRLVPLYMFDLVPFRNDIDITKEEKKQENSLKAMNP